MPLFKDLMNYLVANFPTAAGDTCCRVNYCDLLKYLNWEDNPAPVAKPAAVQCVMKWIEPKPPLKILCVNYRAFLEDVCPNFKCALPSVCCCGTGQPCAQHPCQPPGSEEGFCPNPDDGESELPQCQPQVPIEVHVQPCCIEPISAQGHKCSPDAHTCNDLSGAGDCSQNQGQTQFECQVQAPCCS
ncbi:unnamed protein product [Allacma fusca]|nr:unnamed protein product [Allacma fusca]